MTMRFSRAVRNGTRLTCWNTKPTDSRRNRFSCEALNPEMSCPPTSTRPDVGESSPPAMDNRVVLPDPDGPSRANISLWATVRVACWSATTSLSPDP